ncbi:MAG TPA: cysteine desulfurase-like protein [Candidatus Limnocylindrales bacterium]|nr:cysteine desulfurase-like protein [Candidatus Limnocylindrales bacterium]
MAIDQLTSQLSSDDVAEIRAHFPALSLTQDGQPIAFFDGPGGTQVAQGVIDAISRYYTESNANDGGAFLTSHRSDEVVRRAHAGVAEFLNARSGDEIKFGANMTTLTFHLSRSIGKTLQAGDEIVVTTLDHEANVSPWRAMAEDRGVTVQTVDIHAEDGTLDLDDLDRKLGDRTRLVAVGYASNALGTINPVAEIVRRAHVAGALSYIDAVHFAPHGPIDVQALDTDFLVCSAYKFFGPHAGVLYGKEAVLDGLPPYKVRPAHDHFETGTPNFEAIAATLAAVDYLGWVGERFGGGYAAEFARFAGRRLNLKTGMRAIRAYELELYGRLADGLERIPGAHLWGITDHARFDERTPTAAVTFDGHAPRAVSEALGERGITTWDGNFYAQGLIERLGLQESGGVLRIGLAHYNTADEVDRLIAALQEIVAG